MEKSVYKIPKMDCASEEQMIKMKLEPLKEIKLIEVEISNRHLIVYHSGITEKITSELDSLNLNSILISSETANDFSIKDLVSSNEVIVREKKILWIIFTINFSFFAVELIAGIISNSMGLVADSLDMLADAIVYALALYAVGGTIITKKRIAKFAGFFQIVLAIIGFSEVIRRFIGVEKMPDFEVMIIISLFALAANIFCLYLLQKGKSKEAHMQASMIFTSNDVIINTGVITAGLLVHWLNSSYPDLIIGAIVFIIVARGAYRILQLAK